MDLGTCHGHHNPWQAGIPVSRGLPCPHRIPTKQVGNQGLERDARPCLVRTESGLVQGPGPSFQIPPVAQVWSRRCDVKTKFVTHIPCTVCPAIKKRVCPSGWLREFPEKISQDCRCGPHPILAHFRVILWGVRGTGGAWQGLTYLHICWSSSGEDGRTARGWGRWCLLSIYCVPGPVLHSGPGT